MEGALWGVRAAPACASFLLPFLESCRCVPLLPLLLHPAQLPSHHYECSLISCMPLMMLTMMLMLIMMTLLTRDSGRLLCRARPPHLWRGAG